MKSKLTISRPVQLCTLLQVTWRIFVLQKAGTVSILKALFNIHFLVDVENGKVETVCNIRKGSKAAMKRFADLPDDEREKQLKAAYDKVIESVQTCSEKDLIRYYVSYTILYF